jgi:hypothetical protein
VLWRAPEAGSRASLVHAVIEVELRACGLRVRRAIGDQ